ncbi:PilZ domain-containing protein [Halochromatium roseum]|uniref:PilZ domain-containing protein n=1 Tax=Halochromatium roseum TaxID=391920 RepID=UPI001912FB98
MALSDSASIDRRQHRQTLASDTRRSVRTDVLCYARLELLPRKYGGIYHSLSHNLSCGGVKVRTFQQLRVDSSVLVKLCCSEEADPLTLSGAVVWVSRDAWNEQWEFGIAFTDLDLGIMQRLQAMNKAFDIN